jgi:DtxR family transcriptional regulator, Mn-dependent transcriptional regulator
MAERGLATQEDATTTPVERSYLEVIAYLEARRAPVIAAQLARWMRVRPPTVTSVVQRLEQKGLISRSASAIRLTPEGTAIAERIIRRHRMLERFLYDTLQVPWHEVHREATLLEPTLSPAMEQRIAEIVGDAAVCPHGNPIPGQGTAPLDDAPLTSATVGSWFVITRVDEEAGEDSCTLQLLWSRGLLPGTPLVRLLDPTDGIAVRRADRRIILSRRVAGMLWGRVEPRRG